jgi:hypothetical protein
MPLPRRDPVALLSALASLGEFACRDAPPAASEGEAAIARFTLTEDSAMALAEALVDVRIRLQTTFEALDARQSIELRSLLDELSAAVETRDRAALRAALRRLDGFIIKLIRIDNADD